MRISPCTKSVHRKEVKRVIRDNVKGIRKAKGVMASHVSKVLGYKTPQGYQYLENGQTNITADTLEVIAKVLGEDVAVFYDENLTKSVIKRIEGIGSNG